MNDIDKKSLTPHNDFFYRSLTNLKIARNFLEHRLPQEVKEKINFETLALENGSFIAPQPPHKKTHTDILYAMEMGTGEKLYCYTLCEHQSTSERLMPYRMYRYILAIIDRHLDKHPNGPLPLVWPIIIYNGKKPYRHSTRFLDLYSEEAKPLAKKILTEPIQLLDLNMIQDKKNRNYVWSQILTLALQANTSQYNKDLEIPLQNLGSLLIDIDIKEKKKGINFITRAVYYVLEVTNPHLDKGTVAAYLETVAKKMNNPTQEAVMTLVEKLKQEGIQEGIQKGIQKGIQENAQKIALNMLTNHMDIKTISRLTELPLEFLEKLKESNEPF